MKMVWAAGLLAAWAGGVKERAKPADYPVHALLPGLTIGAEFMVHSFSGPYRTYTAPDYLVVEVAVYPETPLTVSVSQFSLRVNGKKERVFAQTPQFVAASLKYSDWTRRPAATVGAGAGNVGVILGPRQSQGRFPGDNRSRQPPAPPKAPIPPPPGGYEKPEELDAPELAVETALPEGKTRFPVAGYLYFPYKGKISAIKKLELIYDSPAGTAILRLR